MGKRVSLNGAEKDFLHLVSRGAFSNPFSDERDEIDRTLAGVTGDTTREGLLQRMVARVSDEVGRLATAGKAHVSLYPAEERELVQSAFLFEAFHRFHERLDQFILRQIQEPDRDCPVPFAGEALSLLVSRGFTREEAARYFALFYQLRRAFHFIDQSLVGRSASMKQLRLHLWNNVFTSDLRWYALYLWNRLEDFSTLFLGETGTGKGTAAAAIGRSGFIPFDENRACFCESFTRNFIPVTLAQFPETLIESELFGHRKGAFTGAVEHHRGVLGRCSPHGAIFLDEVGDISASVQIKLLQVLQDRTFCEVGGHETIRFQGRVIAATNRRLEDLRRTGGFRDDFFYRLCSDVVEVPPLRQRLAEDPAELEDVLAQVLRRMVGDPPADLLQTVRQAIERDVGRDYAWPGNVRELEQAVRRIILTRRYSGDSRPALDLLDRLLEGLRAGSLDAEGLLAGYCAMLHHRHGTYEEVARRTGLDRRTVKRYVQAAFARGASDPAGPLGRSGAGGEAAGGAPGANGAD